MGGLQESPFPSHQRPLNKLLCLRQCSPSSEATVPVTSKLSPADVPFRRGSAGAEDSRRTSEACHCDLGLQYQMTAIALSLQAPDADWGNTPLPRVLGLDGGEGGGRRSQGQG